MRALRTPLIACLLGTALAACNEPQVVPPPRSDPAAITSTAAIARARATTFGAHGFLVGPPKALAGGRRDRFFAAAVDTSGRLVAAGESERKNGSRRALLARFTLDGRLDPSFGNGDGIVLGADDGDREGFERGVTTDDAFYGVRIDRLGRIVVVGKAGIAGKAKALVARYNSNGRLDLEFGDFEAKHRRGFVIGMGDEYLDDQFSGVRPESSYPDERFHAVELDAQGRIIAAGVTSDLNKSWLADSEACKTWLPAALCRSGFYTTLIARWSDDGQLDTTFNEVGYSTGTGGRGRWWLGRHDEWLDVRVLADGRIVTAGFATGDRPSERRTLLAAYLPNGRLDDDGFGTASARGLVLGPERARAGGTREELASLAIDPRGKLIAAGTSWANDKPRALISRRLSNGAADPSFAEAGYVLEDLAAERPTVRAAIDDQGMIVASAPPKLYRFTTSGAIDETFTASFAGTATSAVVAHDLIADRFGKIYIVGSKGDAWYVARYQKNGQLDRPGE